MIPIQIRREIAAYYESEFKDFHFQQVTYYAKSAYWLFTLKVENRAELIDILDQKGIDTSPIHCRNDTYTAFVQCTLSGDELINTAIYDQKMLCIPVGEWLTDEDAQRIVNALKQG